jgi:double-stranded uracil-DNA glycosylase
MTSRTPHDRIRPTKADLEAARGRTIRDVLAPGLDLVFVGINPGLWSGATGHHFARPGNRFWKSLHAGGFTPRVLSPFEDRDLLSLGLGVTNLVARTTATAAELTDDEVLAGARSLRRRLEKVRPAAAAVLGITAYRTAFGVRDAVLGPQPLEIAGARVWVLPNPSGLNAHYQLGALAERFAELRVALGRPVAR